MTETRNTVWYRFGRTGGTADDMDGIDGNNALLFDDDLCIVVDPDTLISEEFQMNFTSGATEDGVLIVAPDTNPGTKRWHFVRRRSRLTVETLTDTKTMSASDMDGHHLFDPGGADRIVL